MSTVFLIDGGAGRAICAIPALLKYAKLNPDDNFKVCIYGWDNIFWGIPELQDRTFNPENKGSFDNIFLPATKVVSPEPYRLPGYYKQEKHLIEAFDAIINETNEHGDLENIKLVLCKSEELNSATAIGEMQKQYPEKNDRLNIVIQPWGSTVKKVGEYIIDDSTRSLEPDTYLKIIKKLNEKYNLICFSERHHFLETDTVTSKFEGDLRFWAAIIEHCDYFIGVDSVGQHIAKAFNKPGTVILGSTYAENISYANHFNIFEKSVIKKYSPLRISMIDSHLADRLNDSNMQLSDKELDDLLNSIEKDINAKCKKVKK